MRLVSNSQRALFELYIGATFADKLDNIKAMKIIRCNITLLGGCKAINLFGFLIARKNARIDDITINHEEIHTAQMRELLYVFFYIAYVIEWLIRLFMRGNAYRNISFEREAYSNEKDIGYLSKRKIFQFHKYFLHERF